MNTRKLRAWKVLQHWAEAVLKINSDKKLKINKNSSFLRFKKFSPDTEIKGSA